MGIFGRRSGEYSATAANPNGNIHQPPAAPGQSYPGDNTNIMGPGGNGVNNGLPGDNAGFNNNHNSGMTGANNNNSMFGNNHSTGGGPMASNHHNGMTGTGPAPLMQSTSPSDRRSSSESTSTEREANKLARKGKMEGTMGSLFCNSRMKRDGEMHKAQADHLRMQASELSEAQRLEKEAGMRRQRAVGLGADPSHASGNTGFNPNQGLNQGGMGMNNGMGGNGMSNNNGMVNNTHGRF